jgi:tryptophan synthase beta chain
MLKYRKLFSQKSRKSIIKGDEKMKNVPYKIYLSENEMPKSWHNIQAVMRDKVPPFLNPANGEPCPKEALLPVFCTDTIEQEFNTTDEFIAIPEEIVGFYSMYRPSPVVRAYCLEKLLGTPAKIFYKFEGNNTSGSHKLNSAAAQAYYAKKQGLTGVTKETG